MRTILLLFLVLALAGCNADQGAEQTADQMADQGAQQNAGPGATGSAQSGQTDRQSKAQEPHSLADSRTPAESAPREASDYQPAFPGQTRAPQPADTEDWTIETVAAGLEHPWSIEFLPDGSMLVSERPGRLRQVTADGRISEPLGGVPEVDSRRQGGLLDIAVSPNFDSDRTIFLTFSQIQDDGTNNTAVARARLSEDARNLEDLEVIFSQYPSVDSVGHYGSRIVFQDAQTLWVGLGDRQGDPVRKQAQETSNTIGTVVRIHTDGSIPTDNPFVGQADHAPEIWSYGHRNIQAAARQPATGDLWTVEHGPRGGDELNRPEAGKNYGWPTISYGIEYRGGAVYEGQTAAEGMEQPVYYWDPVIAPSGMVFYTGQTFPSWRNNLFVGGLRTLRVSRLILDDHRVVAEQWLPIGHRVRDITQGPDDCLYLVTDEPEGQVLRIVPASG